MEQCVVETGGGAVSQPTLTAPSPRTGILFSAEMHHQRVDQAHPDDNVPSNIEGLDKDNTPETGMLLVKLGLLRLQCAVPRRNPISSLLGEWSRLL